MIGKEFLSTRAFEQEDSVSGSIRLENCGSNDEGGVGFCCGKEVSGEKGGFAFGEGKGDVDGEAEH